ncbi:hypothetical protein A3A46_00530 [Candidatus Roizmanbacteria bacterium RIFCSPLOWO2_01_FULL_37_13]|uniref:NADP-dependent oxidoreductase domain-containing protein n=1 Tax=Candidatus Roizmanbacteria bacterium RIFCSPHIGHO2_02_FULL_38_11 TaxID=1802039 RepID=A0A1F7GZ09_9BACT|nr:MAG: hypothetical protein A3C25_00290 [Candidatus Roizmanbacteria bacterium RIFCSPHIGHO2_02_FULL_38_11]OGK34770.1 MAG: hypothetical protein A3F58_04295 [Candidatus Roizmanbacteria bacterium RIFCSPHIGHO2_12_FULL_37_9b]OGK41743.1 MAG: hypothetical protein A3A46_00530 [Candidatus Roizmanbacteria bacterium RIFCSPLOWO2_01_FULL_37_13]
MHNRVGLGTFPLAGVFNKITKEKAKELVKLFLKSGGYYIDVAPMYGFGEVEKLLGEVLKDFPRDQFYLITKCGYKDVEGKTFQTIPRGAKYEDVIRECEISLKRLNLNYIDLYFVHFPDPVTPFEETMKALNKLQEQGKIKEIGVSNVNLIELKEYQKYGKVKFIQNRFSLINRSINPEFQKYLLENKIGLIPYQVIDRGQITGKVFEGIDQLREGDLRIGRSDWLSEQLNLISRWVKNNLSPIAKRLKITLGQLSIAWVLHQNYLSFVIVGATNREFIPINLKANDIKLDKKTLEEIDIAYSKLEKEIKQKYGQTIREFRGLNEKYY